MSYTVALTPSAEQDLAAAWLAARDRRAVTAAADEIERELSASPLIFGESRASGVNRVGWVPPLGFTFDVVADDSVVFITAVWLIS